MSSTCRKHIAHKRVPIREIFEIEFAALKMKQSQRIRIQDTYEKQILRLTEAVIRHLPKDNDNTSEFVAQAGQRGKERTLFAELMHAFHANVGTKYRPYAMVVDLPSRGEFNCYSATVMLADVLTRAGKAVNIALVPSHIFVVGEENAMFAKTAKSDVVHRRREIGSFYSSINEVDVSKLLSCAHMTAGRIFMQKDMNHKSLSSFIRAERITPKDPDVLCNKGVAYLYMGFRKAAERAYLEGLKINGDHGELLFNYAALLNHSSRYIEALHISKKAARINSADVQTLELVETILRNLGRDSEAKRYAKMVKGLSEEKGLLRT
jgi:tetratricopeptide (TPR) repeat protein